MQLRRLELQRFRAFQDIEIEFPEQGLVLIAGANNSGKSALLSAIDAIAGGQVPGARHHGSSQPAVVEAEFALTNEERASVMDVGVTSVWVRRVRLFERIRVRFTDRGDGKFSLSRVKARDRGSRSSFVTVDTAESNGPVSYSRLHSLQGLSNAEVPNLAAVLRATSATGEDPLRRLSFASPLLSTWSQSVYHFNAIRTGTPRQTAITAIQPILHPSGENLAQCLLYHSSQESATWDRVRATMNDVLPDAGRLVVPTSDNQATVAFVDPDSGERRNLKDLGSGVEQLLMLAYVGASHPPEGLVLLEEPETSLHPGAQRELMRHLLDWTKDRVFIATTHSPVLLDRRPSSEGALVLVTRRDGVSVARAADGDLREVLDAVGVQLSDVLSAERILLVEGTSDAALLRAWFPDLVLRRECATVALGGGDRVFHLDTIERVLDGIDAIGRSVLFVRDRDELAPRRRERLTADPRVHLLDRRELENYLLDEEGAIAEVLERRAAHPGYVVRERFSEASLAQAIRDEADALQPVVILKRTVEAAVPPRFVDRATIGAIVDAGASLEGLSAALDESLAAAHQARDDLAQAWEQEATAVQSAWQDGWKALVPGADVLQAIWRRAGGRYDKVTDGALVAARARPPAELSTALKTFLGSETQ